MDYSSLTAPVKAIAWGHLAPTLTSTLSLWALLITPLAPETVSIRMEGTCDATSRGCIPSLSIYPVAGRLVQGILFVMALLTVILILHMVRYSTGIFAEASSIAGLATLFHHPDVVDDLRQARGASTASMVHLEKYLGRNRYRIDFYCDQDGLEKYGIVPEHASGQPAYVPQKVGAVYTRQIDSPILEENVRFKHPHLAGAVGLICFLLGLLAILVYYRMTDTDSGFEQFMDSEGFGVKFLFTAIGVLIKLYWGSIFKGIASSLIQKKKSITDGLFNTDVTQLEPYRNLAKRNANARDCILVSSYSIPLTAIPSSIKRGHLFTALVAFVAFLADALTVTLSNIQFRPQTTWMAYTVCTWMSCSIIGLMVITLIALAFRRQPNLPLKPSSIAAVLSLLCWSSMPARFGDLAMMSERKRNKRIDEMNVRYGIGGLRDDNGQVVVGIEVDRSTFRTGLG